MTGKNCLQSLLDQIHIRLWCADAGLRLLLKRMQHMDRITDAHRIDSTKSIASVIFHQLIHA